MRQIFVDSRDRISGTTTAFSIQLPETLVLEGQQHKCRIDNLRIPNVVPTITTGTNDTIIVHEGSTNYTVTIAQGNYDGPALATALQALLFAAAPGTWTVVYDVYNIAMKISCTNSFTIVGGTYAAQLLSHPYTSTSTSYSFTYVSVLGLDVAYLSSSIFANLNIVGPNGAHDTLMCAVVTVPYAGVIDVSMPYDVWIDVPGLTVQQLSFELRDRNYNVLSIVPNISFVMSID
jgi:hypothetical protein